MFYSIGAFLSMDARKPCSRQRPVQRTLRKDVGRLRMPMSELARVFDDLLWEAHAGRTCALCAVVHTVGSTPQLPGAILFIREDRSTSGTLGGGCVEAEVILRVTRDVMPHGEAAYMEFNLNHSWGWDDGLICGGRMDIAAMASLKRRTSNLIRRSSSPSGTEERPGFPSSPRKMTLDWSTGFTSCGRLRWLSQAPATLARP